ncbi:Asparaginase/glutaminase [Colletotrichum godetiae]|uniref:asparaginase n=1 Tax=Colletotrichum godetiae TaxID=1209918 RepID=A0AAJ0EQB9_9PEZI|nr:Asparaginase/glutaminase [Colletotrichum godetiae]KAK1657303.1 Asparaginase/glutaminase [Colletotrichum godetiae]
MAHIKKLALIPTGGTIGILAEDIYNNFDYGSDGNGRYATLEELRSRTDLSKLEKALKKEIQIEHFKPIDSTAMTPKLWFDLARRCDDLSQASEIDGIVISHGTATMEETAFALSLVMRLRVPVIITGSMRPLNGMSSDAMANLTAAFHVAAHKYKEEQPGVLVVINNEIHLSIHVKKTHVSTLNTFKSPNFAPIGQVGCDGVRFLQEPKWSYDSEFDRKALLIFPRVDILTSYCGADETLIDFLVGSGAKGIVLEGFPPGLGTPQQTKGLVNAISKDVIVVQAASADGEVINSADHQKLDIIAAGFLTSKRARILLGFCLANRFAKEDIAAIFKKFQ